MYVLTQQRCGHRHYYAGNDHWSRFFTSAAKYADIGGADEAAERLRRAVRAEIAIVLWKVEHLRWTILKFRRWTRRHLHRIRGLEPEYRDQMAKQEQGCSAVMVITKPATIRTAGIVELQATFDFIRNVYGDRQSGH